MSRTACVFPGQNSQKPGMLSELAAAFPQFTATFDEASEALGYDLWQLIQEDDGSRLNQTEVTQPAILASSVAIWRLLAAQGKLRPVVMAGHSLGEYSALVCAGVIDFKEAISLVRKRGQYMQTAVPAGVGAMAAIIGLDDDKVVAACEQAAQDQLVSAVNFNSPGQVVIAGHAQAVDRASVLCREAGAKRAMPLAVSAPFHCALMKPAADAFSADLAAVRFSSPQIPVLQNFGLSCESDPEVIRANLVAQIYNPVPWVQTVALMSAMGASLFLEVGPGNVLSGLMKRIDRELKALPVNTPESLQEALDGL